MSATYTTLQQIFCLNQIANAASSRIGTQAELQTYAHAKIGAVLANADVQALIGTWNLVWGPVVYQHAGGKVADNTLFVAQRSVDGTPQQELVVGIAGTNPISWYGWIVEDFTLSPMTPWPYDTPACFGNVQITHGTATGLGILQAMTSGGKTLSAFLADTVAGAASPWSISVSGHSLGGALSPTLALALADTQGPGHGAAGWDPDYRAVVSVVPSAGPTPGNQAFALYYDQRLGTRTNRIYNSIDIVPHAWQLDQLAAAPHFYYPYLVPNAAVFAVTGLAAANSAVAGRQSGPLTQLNAQTAPLSGQVNLQLRITPAMVGELEIQLINALVAIIGKKLGLTPVQIKLAQQLIDQLLRGKVQAPTTLEALAQREPDLVAQAEAVPLEGLGTTLYNLLMGLLDFLMQAGMQHTSAYPLMLGTEAFAQLSDKVQPST